jgi:XTP/dITP diphosphohydrolase
MTIWFASGNTHKKKEMSAIFTEAGVIGNEAATDGNKLLIPADMGLAFDPQETGDSFRENALLKAMELYALLQERRPSAWHPGNAIVADDSGLCVDVLGGRPGIFSARYMGKDGDYSENVISHNVKKLDDARRNALLLEELGDSQGRSARFVCAMVLLFSPGRFFVAQETLEGEIVRSPEFSRGTGGFGYDPILYIPEMCRTVAELSEAEKNQISHRGKAGKVIAGILGNI